MTGSYGGTPDPPVRRERHRTRGAVRIEPVRHYRWVAAEIDLVVPMKSPYYGKSRLRGATSSQDAHNRLVLALAGDTLAAASATPGIRKILVVAADPISLEPLGGLDVELVDDADALGLNPALLRGERILRERAPAGVVGVLQADLPALRPTALAAAVAEAAGRRAFVADRHGTGTTLLLSAPAEPLLPRFGLDSAIAHAESGATALSVPAPSLRGDVDTPADLSHARELGLGQRSSAVLMSTAGVA